MNMLEKGVQAITEYLKAHPEERGKVVDRATVYAIAHSFYPEISKDKENMLPTDICWNIINGNDPNSKMLRDFGNFPHALLAEDDGFRLVGSDYEYEGPVFHRGWGKNFGYFKGGAFYKGENMPEEIREDLPEGILLKREDLKMGLEEALKGVPVSIKAESNKVTVNFQELLICGVSIEDETNRIYNASSEWAEKTTYLCEEDGDGKWFYYLDTIDECIGECKRLVMFEAQKGKSKPETSVSHTSELSKVLDRDTFERTYRSFLEQADANVVSGNGNGGQTPKGFDKKPNCDGADVSTHYGMGNASKTPYLNWWVVSIYYLPDSGNIVMGIEEDRYPHLKEMKIEPLRYTKIGNKKVDTAVFYSSSKSNLNYAELHEKFLCVCEEVMRLGLK